MTKKGFIGIAIKVEVFTELLKVQAELTKEKRRKVKISEVIAELIETWRRSKNAEPNS
jgi:predicted CopG family antitoxin